MAAMRMRKRLWFAGAAMTLSAALVLGTLLLADVYAHHSVERSAGLNRWGYRGPVAGRKAAGEARVAVLGGSTAFGYGRTWDEAFPAQLAALLQQGPGVGAVSVVNLAYNNEGAYSYRFTLDDYRFLGSDVVVLYEGYNDLMGENGHNTSVARHESLVFRLTGYMPMLPTVIREKALMLRYGDLNAAYAARRGGDAPKRVFRPSVANRTAAAALEMVANVSDRVEAGMAPERPTPAPMTEREAIDGCEAPWRTFCRDVADATAIALSRGMSAVIVTQPWAVGNAAQAHHDQQRALVAMVSRRFGAEPRVSYVSLGDAVDLTRRDLSFDGMHLTRAGNRIIAERLLEPVRRAIAGRSR